MVDIFRMVNELQIQYDDGSIDAGIGVAIESVVEWSEMGGYESH